MLSSRSEILTINSLLIGYTSGKHLQPILPPLDASVRKGELVAVLGRNGIGKSTLMRTITGLQSSLGGKVMINKEDASRFSRVQLAQKVGYISTEIIRVSHMCVYDLVALGRFPYTNWIGRIDDNARIIIEEAIKKAGLANFKNRFISELSDGERQRAMIARVLAQDTDIMIMDEPMAFLDIPGKFGIINLMRDLTAAGKTIVFSTHDFSIAINHADKIWLLEETRLIQGAPEDLLLGNAFDSLFDMAIVGFNPDDGSFSYRSAPQGKIYVEGVESASRHYTVKALARAGFIASNEKMTPYIKLPSAGDGWILFTKDGLQKFGSLYDLISFLRKEKRVIT